MPRGCPHADLGNLTPTEKALESFSSMFAKEGRVRAESLHEMERLSLPALAVQPQRSAERTDPVRCQDEVS